MVVGGVEEAAGRIGEVRRGSRPSSAARRRRTSARRRSPRTARAGRRRGRRSPRARPGPIARPSFHDRPSAPSGATQPGEDRARRRWSRRRGSASAASGRDRASSRAASANAAIASPFQAASALSSRAGCGRVARRREQPRARRPRAGARDLGRRMPERSASSRPAGRRDRIVTPSQLPSSVTPYAAREQRGASSPSTSRISVARPGERRALDAVGVGVLAGGERAVGASSARGACSRASPVATVAIARVAGQRPRVHVDARELGVVVEHLLEVRHEPDRRRSSSGGSRRRAGRGCRRRPSRRACAGPSRSGRGSPVATCRRSRNSIVIGCGNFGRAAPAAVDARRSVALERGRGRVEQRRASGRRAPAAEARCCSTSVATSRAAGRLDLVALARATPGRRRRAPGGTTAARGAARPGSRCRRRTAGRRASGRPSSASRRCPVIAWTARHVDLVEVGPLLAVDLDRDEVARSGSAAVASSSNDSRSMTWHQWQAA